jgi:uncharacterized membrane protein
MIPGTTTKLSESTLASAATLDPKTDLVRVTGTTSIANITPHFGGGFSGILFLVPVSGNVATTTTGNIGVAVTMLQNKVTVLVYSKTDDKWYTHALS